MLKLIYEVTVTDHDWFDHFRSSSQPEKKHSFTSLMEAWAFYKEQKKTDFCWPGDHERYTSRPHRKMVFVEDTQQKHGYVRGHAFDYIFDRLEDKYKGYKKNRLKRDVDGIIIAEGPFFEDDLPVEWDDDIEF